MSSTRRRSRCEAIAGVVASRRTAGRRLSACAADGGTRERPRPSDRRPRASTTARRSRSGPARPSRSRPTCSSTRTTPVHENQVELTVVPNDDYVAKVGAAAGSDGLPDLFAADIVYVPNWVEQGLFQDITANIDGLDVQGRDQQGPPRGGHARRQGVRAAVRARPLDAVLEQGALRRGRPRPREGARPTSQEFADGRQGRPGAEQARHLRHRHRPELRRMPRLHLVPERLGRRRGGHDRRRHRVAARQRHRQGDLLHVEGPVGLGRRAPVVAGRGRTRPGPRASPRARSACMFYPATLLSSTPFDVGVAGIPGPEGGASTFVGGDGIGVSKDSKKGAQAWNFLNWMMSEEAQVERAREEQRRGLALRPRRTTSTPTRTRAWSRSTRSPPRATPRSRSTSSRRSTRRAARG